MIYVIHSAYDIWAYHTKKITLNKRNIQDFYERTGQKWGQCWSRTNLNGFADHYLPVRTITQIYDEENEIEKYTNFVGIEPTTSCLQNVRSTNKLKIRCNSFSDYHHICTPGRIRTHEKQFWRLPS